MIHKNLKTFVVDGNNCPLKLRQIFLRYERRLKKQLKIAHCRIRRPGVLSSLKSIASNNITYDALFIMDCKSAYYIDILILLGGAVCREIHELWPIFGYVELCGDRDLNCGRQLVT